MRNGKYGFGLVGIGMGGITHAVNFNKMDDVEFVACYGRNQEKADAFAAEYGVNTAYSDFEAFCADPDLDFVVVCLPNALHGEHAIALANAGKNVIVEKPLETTVEKARAIIKACEENNVNLSVIYQMRYGDAAQKVKKAVEEGKFGDILQIDAFDKAYREVSYYRDDAWRGTTEYEGGGTLITQTTHLLDLMQWIGGPVSKAYAKTRTAFHDIETEDLANAILTFKSGASGVVVSSTCFRPALKSRVEVHGTKGSAIFNGEYDEFYLWDVDGDDEKIDAPEGFKFRDVTDPMLFPMERHLLNLRDVLDSYKAGKDPLIPGPEGLKATVVKNAIYDSAKLGREIDIEM